MFYLLSPVVCHSSHTSYRCTCYYYIAHVECAVLYKHSSYRTSSLVEPCFYYYTLCTSVGIRLKLCNLSGEKNHFEKLIYTLFCFCGNRYARYISSPFLGNYIVLGKLLLYSIGICPHLIHFVYCYYYGNACCLCMIYSLYRLRHDTVIGCYNKYCYIGSHCTSCPHSRKCFVSGGIKEGYFLSVHLNTVCSYMLCNTSCFAHRYICVTYSVKQRGLSVVNVSHNYNYRCSFYQVAVIVLAVVYNSFLDSYDNLFFNLCVKFHSYK